MSLKNLYEWNIGTSKNVSSACGAKSSACGAKKRPSACGTK